MNGRETIDGVQGTGLSTREPYQNVYGDETTGTRNAEIRDFHASEKLKVLVVVGPTASGKTSLSIALAKQFDGEVVSADSRQVYKGLDIGSGKVTEEEMDGVPHHLLDVADPNKTYTVADFVRDGRNALADIHARGKLPIIAGGTFFYVDALLGRVQMPEVPPNPELRTKLETKNTEELFEELQQKDPRRAADIDEHNKVRLIRALEIVDAVGVVPSLKELGVRPLISNTMYDVLIIGIDIDKETLHKNIHTRLVTRLDHGMVEEVERLHAEGVSWERLEELGLEYRYIALFLQNKLSKEEMVERLESEIKKFTKRQMTWLKRDTTIQWFKKEATDDIHETVKIFCTEST